MHLREEPVGLEEEPGEDVDGDEDGDGDLGAIPARLRQNGELAGSDEQGHHWKATLSQKGEEDEDGGQLARIQAERPRRR